MLVTWTCQVPCQLPKTAHRQAQNAVFILWQHPSQGEGRRKQIQQRNKYRRNTAARKHNTYTHTLEAVAWRPGDEALVHACGCPGLATGGSASTKPAYPHTHTQFSVVPQLGYGINVLCITGIHLFLFFVDTVLNYL